MNNLVQALMTESPTNDEWLSIIERESKIHISRRMKGETTPRRAIALWQMGAPAILPVQKQLNDIACRASDEHDEAQCRSFNRKSYASMARRYPFSAVVFRMR